MKIHLADVRYLSTPLYKLQSIRRIDLVQNHFIAKFVTDAMIRNNENFFNLRGIYLNLNKDMTCSREFKFIVLLNSLKFMVSISLENFIPAE